MTKNCILWVSRFQGWKQPDLFIELAEKIPDERFWMICPPPKGKEIENWEKLKSRAILLPNLQFIDYVPFSQIQDYFNKAFVLVNTSRAEGFPNTFLQAAQGRAAIVSLAVNPGDFISKYDCGVFCENDFDLLVKNLAGLVKNKKLLQKKGKIVMPM
ncbi:MAG: glycosyltransferase [Chloroflexia bacterium]|nr:glycosyltransferase [Chloroflexia bacterium]